MKSRDQGLIRHSDAADNTENLPPVRGGHTVISKSESTARPEPSKVKNPMPKSHREWDRRVMLMSHCATKGEGREQRVIAYNSFIAV